MLLPRTMVRSGGSRKVEIAAVKEITSRRVVRVIEEVKKAVVLVWRKY